MHNSWSDVIGPITLRSNREDFLVAPTLRDAAEIIRRRHLDIIDHPLPKAYPDCSWSLYGRTLWVCLDESGLIIPLWRIKEVLAELKPIPSPRWAYQRWRGYDPKRDFRKTPVKGTGRFRYGRYFRHMRTFGELRDNLGLEADLRDLEDFPVRVKIRGRRKALPTLWDDFYKESQKSWKKHRRTQWKE